MTQQSEEFFDKCNVEKGDISESSSAHHAVENEASFGTSITGLKWILVCVSLCLSAFLYGLDTTIAADVQGPIIETFEDVSQLTWVGAGFPLGSMSMTLIVGAAYARFDMKWLFIASVVIFEVGSAICGAAPSMNALIVGRVIAGVGGAGIYMGALNYFSICTSDQKRGTYIAGMGLIWGLGSILGPVIGGAFAASSATWRWAFYINLVVAAICAPIYFSCLPSISAMPNASTRAKLGGLDIVGAVLWVGIVNAFTIVLTFAGNCWPWNDGRTIATFVILAVVLAAFVLQQKFAILTNEDCRIFPGHLLKSRSQVLLYIGTAAAGTNLFVPAYYIPIFFQFTRQDGPIEAAVRLLPFILVLISVNMVSGALLPRIGYYWILYFISGVFMTVGGALMITVGSDTAAGNIYGYSVLISIGSGLTIQTGYAVATMKRNLAGHPEDIPNAVAFQNTSQLGSTLTGLVISGQIFQSYALRNLSDALAGQGYTTEELRSAIGGTQSQVLENMNPEMRQEAIIAIAAAFSRVWILSLVAGVVSLTAGLLMKKERLTGLKAAAGG